MEIIALLGLIIGGVLVIVGLGFIFPWKNVAKLKGETTGVIKDITELDASAFNEKMAEKSGLSKPAGKGIYVKTTVGGRQAGDAKVMFHSIYAYTVDGVEYTRADGLGYNKGLAEKKIGKEVTVHYNPNSPFQASLSSGKGYKYLSIGLISGGAFFLLIALVCGGMSMLF